MPLQQLDFQPAKGFVLRRTTPKPVVILTPCAGFPDRSTKRRERAIDLLFRHIEVWGHAHPSGAGSRAYAILPQLRGDRVRLDSGFADAHDSRAAVRGSPGGGLVSFLARAAIDSIGEGLRSEE